MVILLTAKVPDEIGRPVIAMCRIEADLEWIAAAAIHRPVKGVRPTLVLELQFADECGYMTQQTA